MGTSRFFCFYLFIEVRRVFHLFAQRAYHRNGSFTNGSFTKINSQCYRIDLSGSMFNVASSHWDTL